MTTVNTINLVGTSGQAISSQGPTLPPVGISAGTLGGSGVLLSTQTASSSFSVPFTSVISATYNSYRVIGTNIVTAGANVNLILEVSTNNGSTWDSTNGHYSWVQRGYALNSTNTGASVGSTGSTSIALMNGVNTTSTVSVILEIINPGANFGFFRWMVQGINNTPVRQTVLGSGVYEQAAAFNAFRLRFSSVTNTTSGTYKCYGYL